MSAHTQSEPSTVIPPSHDARTIILCFDGTGDQFDADNSNIVQFFSMLKKDDKSQQVCYYQAGIGTYTIPEIATPFWSGVRKKIDAAFANHLDAHVMGGYEFLMENYHAEDKICIFGFSRGAYTALALAGMLHKVGLLPAGNHQQVPFAYKMYSRDDQTGRNQSKAFKKAFSTNVEIEFVGVWDTVSSVGIVSRTLPSTACDNSIRYLRHAIALDEHRVKYQPNYYRPTDFKNCTSCNSENMPRSNQRFQKKSHQDYKSETQSEPDGEFTKTNVKEVWFAGCHCDVGGGSVKNGKPHSLARIPLRWMIRQCFLAKTGIQFHGDSFKEVGLEPLTLYPDWDKLHETEFKVSDHDAESLPAPSEVELLDAKCKIYDQLKSVKGCLWWILEILPLRMHLGRPRKISKPIREKKEKIYVHRSVKIRMETEAKELEGGKTGDSKYKPKANFENLDYYWVD